MAVTRSSARRYAEAAFEIAERDGSMEAWLAVLSLAEARLAAPEVVRLLSNPAVPSDARVEILGRILGDEVSGPPRNLLVLLVRRSRFELLPGIIREFRRLHRQREGIVQARVTSAAPLGDEEQEALRERLVALTGSRVEMQQEVDPELLGGLQVRLGDRLMDGSVRGRLERLRARFTTTAI